MSRDEVFSAFDFARQGQALPSLARCQNRAIDYVNALSFNPSEIA
jgi:hypothetical protein